MSFQDSIYRVFGGVVQIRLIHSIDSFELIRFQRKSNSFEKFRVRDHKIFPLRFYACCNGFKSNLDLNLPNFLISAESKYQGHHHLIISQK